MAGFIRRCEQDVVWLQISMNNLFPLWPACARMKYVGSISTVTQSTSNAVEHMPYKGLGKNKAVIAVSRVLWIELFRWGADTFFVGTRYQVSISFQTQHIRSRYENVL